MGEEEKISPANVLTFEELRSIQKKGRINDSLQNLGPNFLERVAQYLQLKRNLSDKLSTKEYENAVRVMADIFEIRERKIIRLASLSARTKIPVKNLTEHEKTFFENMKEEFKRYNSFLNKKMGFQEIEDDEENVGAPAKKETKESPEELKGVVKESPLAPEEKIEVTKDLTDLEEVKVPTNETNAELKETIEETQAEPETEIKESEEVKEEVKTADETLETEKTEEEKEIELNSHKIKLKSPVPKFLGVDLEVYGPYEEGDVAELPPKNAEVLINQRVAEPLKNIVQNA